MSRPEPGPRGDFFAVVLAAQRAGTIDPLAEAHGLTHKCLVPIEGSPLIAHLVVAMFATPGLRTQRIVVEPEVRFGKPTVRGTRITVGDVLSYLASGMSEDEILADFSQLSREDLRACLAFAAERERRLTSVPGS